jgi:hypothetical protein
MNVIPEKIVKMLRCLGTKKDANAKIISMTVKECFCNKFKSSHICNLKNCDFEKENIFCAEDISKEKSDDFKSMAKSDPNYCANNIEKPECICLINPYQGYCLCLNDPLICSSKFFIINISSSFNYNRT